MHLQAERYKTRLAPSPPSHLVIMKWNECKVCCHYKPVLTQIQLQLTCASTTTLTKSQERVAPYGHACQGGRAHMPLSCAHVYPSA